MNDVHGWMQVKVWVGLEGSMEFVLRWTSESEVQNVGFIDKFIYLNFIHFIRLISN